MTSSMVQIHDLHPEEIVDLARAQIAGSYSAESDGLTALNLIIALANRVVELQSFIASQARP